MKIAPTFGCAKSWRERTEMSNLNIIYLIPLLLIIYVNSFYHFISKSTSETLNLFLGLTAIYSIALIFSIIIFLIKSDSVSFVVSKIKAMNWKLWRK